MHPVTGGELTDRQVLTPMVPPDRLEQLHPGPHLGASRRVVAHHEPTVHPLKGGARLSRPQRRVVPQRGAESDRHNGARSASHSHPQRVDRITAAVAYDGPMYILTTQLGGPQIIHGGRLAAGCLRTYTANAPLRRPTTAYTELSAR